MQCKRIVTPAMRQAAFKASVEALVNDPNAAEHIASIIISQKQMNMTAEMHEASKAWLQQLHKWGLILKGAIAVEKGETMRREHEQIMCWFKAPCTKETSDKLRELFEEYGNMPEPRGPKGNARWSGHVVAEVATV